MFVFFPGVRFVVLPQECEEVANGDGYSLAFVSRLFTSRDKKVQGCVLSGPCGNEDNS